MPAAIDPRAPLTRASVWLERAVLAVALAALAFRALLYPRLAPSSADAIGTGDLADFALALLLFGLSLACAATGVLMSLRAGSQPRAYRPVLVGITTFALYLLVHPHIPALG